MSLSPQTTDRDAPATGRRDWPLSDLQDFVENACVGMRLLAPDGTITWANRADHELLGYTHDEFVGQKLRDFYANPGRADELVRRLAAGETVQHHEAAVRCRDGSLRYVSVSGRARLDEHGRALHLRCCTEDVTFRQCEVLEARANRRALTLLARVSRAVVERADLDQSFERIAHEVAEVLGDCCAVHLVSPDAARLELRGFYHREPAACAQVASQGERSLPVDVGLGERVLREARPLRLAHVELATLSELFGPQSAHDFFSQFMAHSLLVVPLVIHGKALGTLAVWRESVSPYSDADERLLSDLADRMAVGIEQKAMVDAVRRSNEQLRTIAEASDLFGQSLDYERTLQSLTRLTVPTLGDFGFFDIREGKAVRRIAHAHENPAMQATLERSTWIEEAPPELGIYALSSSKSSLHPHIDDAFLVRVARTPEDLAFVRALGLRSMISVPLVYQNEVLGAMTLCFNSSGRTHAEPDLALAEELARRAAAALVNARLFKEARDAIGVRDDFLSMAGHELRTPLTALQLQILSITKMMSQPDALEKIAGRADKAGKNVLRLSNLVNELLDISRISAGRLRLERGTVNLGDAVREVLNRHAEELTKNGCALQLDAAAEVVGSWDRSRIEQIVANLVANAMKYGKGKPIEVTVTCDEAKARLTVRDHGIGISPDDLQRIFQRFERAVSSRHFGGLGLGLWIARQLVDAHGGEIRVDSERDCGATFEVDLPLTPIDEVAA